MSAALTNRANAAGKIGNSKMHMAIRSVLVLCSMCIPMQLLDVQGSEWDERNLDCEALGFSIKVVPPFFIQQPMMEDEKKCHDTSTVPSADAAQTIEHTMPTIVSLHISNTHKGGNTETIHIHVGHNHAFYDWAEPFHKVPPLADIELSLKVARDRARINVIKPPAAIKFSGRDAADMTIDVTPGEDAYFKESYRSREISTIHRHVKIGMTHNFNAQDGASINLEDVFFLIPFGKDP